MDGDDDNMEVDEGVEMTERDGAAVGGAFASYGGEGGELSVGGV